MYAWLHSASVVSLERALEGDFYIKPIGIECGQSSLYNRRLTMSNPITLDEIRNFAAAWYLTLDEHVPG